MSIPLTRRDVMGRLIPKKAIPSVVDIGTYKRVLNRATFGPTNQDMVDIASVGWRVWVKDQIDWRSIDDSVLEAGIAGAGTSLTLPARFLMSWMARCLFSKRQLQYRMVSFWENHFNTDLSKTDAVAEIPENDSFRKVAFENFEEILSVSAHSPAMMAYLDNNTNVWQQPNENYARELLELHTLGVNGGYSDPADILMVARVLTGWSYRVVGAGTPNPTVKFTFRPSHHDSGPKTVMGWSTPGFSGSKGLSEGEDLLKYLAAHSSTATRLATKLCMYFAHDNPPANLVQHIANIIGAGRPTSEAVLGIFDFVAGEQSIARDKTQDPQEFIFSTLRRLEVQWPTNLLAVNYWIGSMGQPLFRYHIPTGYPETGPSWQKAGTQMARWRFVHELTTGGIQNMSIGWLSLAGSFATPTELLDNLLARLVDGEMDTVTYNELLAWVTVRASGLSLPPTNSQLATIIKDLSGLILRLPAAGTN